MIRLQHRHRIIPVFHAKITASMGFKHIKLFKRTIIQQQINPFSGSHAPFGVLLVNSLLTTAQLGLVP